MAGNKDARELDKLERVAVENVERNVRAARNALFTVTLICAFLSAVVFEMFFGWSKMRPSASHRIFLRNIAAIATAAEKEPVKWGVLEKGIQALAREQVNLMLGHDRKSHVDSLADSAAVEEALIDRLDGRDAALKERHLYMFAEAAARYESLLCKGYENRVETAMRLEDDLPMSAEHGEGVGTPGGSDSQKNPESSGSPEQTPGNESPESEQYAWMSQEIIDAGIKGSRALQFNDPRFALRVREIHDRYRVNQNIRTLQSSKHSIPLVGITLPLEDINPVVSVILLFLVFWLASAARRMRDSVEACIRILREKVGSWIPIIASSFFFIEYHARDGGRDNEPRLVFVHRAAFLMFFPYIIIASGVAGGLFENWVLDIQRHGSDAFIGSATWTAQWYFTAVTGVIAVFAYRSAYNMARGFYELYHDLIHHDLWIEPGLSGVRARSTAVRFPFRVRGAFWIIGFLPFIIFGSFILLYRIGGLYQREHFLSWEIAIAHGVFTAATVFVLIMFLLRREVAPIDESRPEKEPASR